LITESLKKHIRREGRDYELSCLGGRISSCHRPVLIICPSPSCVPCTHDGKAKIEILLSNLAFSELLHEGLDLWLARIYPTRRQPTWSPPVNGISFIPFSKAKVIRMLTALLK
jgi:hypothetical protein